MLKQIKLATFVLTAIALTGCATTKFVSTWAEPGAVIGTLTGKKVVAVIVSEDQGTRRAAEAALSRELTARGAIGIASYTLLPGDLAKDREHAKKVFADKGVDGVIVMRASGERQELNHVQGTNWYGNSRYNSMWGYWDYGWGHTYSPGYITTDTIVSVETLIYSVNTGKLIWAGKTETTNPTKINKFIQELALAVDDELVKGGLLD